MSPPKNLSIVVDWGTSNFRAYLVQADGQCLERIDSADGLNNIERPFADVLLGHITHWLQQYGPLTALLSGMVGSPSGWREVPHLASPASVAQLAQQRLLKSLRPLNKRDGSFSLKVFLPVRKLALIQAMPVATLFFIF